MSTVTHINDQDFEQSIKTGLTLVDFWATWCGPCVALAPVLDELANTYDGKVKVAKMDIDKNNDTPVRFQVRSIPTLILFKDGEQVDMFVGNDPQKIVAMLDRHTA